jgi:hypothetical protein
MLGMVQVHVWLQRQQDQQSFLSPESHLYCTVTIKIQIMNMKDMHFPQFIALK